MENRSRDLTFMWSDEDNFVGGPESIACQVNGPFTRQLVTCMGQTHMFDGWVVE